MRATKQQHLFGRDNQEQASKKLRARRHVTSYGAARCVMTQDKNPAKRMTKLHRTETNTTSREKMQRTTNFGKNTTKRQQRKANSNTVKKNNSRVITEQHFAECEKQTNSRRKRTTRKPTRSTQRITEKKVRLVASHEQSRNQ